MNALKKFLPDPKLIPAILIIGGIGGVVLAKAVPALMTKLAGFVPTIQKPAGS